MSDFARLPVEYARKVAVRYLPVTLRSSPEFLNGDPLAFMARVRPDDGLSFIEFFDTHILDDILKGVSLRVIEMRYGLSEAELREVYPEMFEEREKLLAYWRQAGENRMEARRIVDQREAADRAAWAAERAHWEVLAEARKAQDAEHARKVAEKKARKAARIAAGIPAKAQVSPFRDRTIKMLEMRSQGQTFQAIGDAFGVHRERVRQIVAKEQRRLRHPRFWLPSEPCRPIDMGGERDVWHDWTPEQNARELGLI